MNTIRGLPHDCVECGGAVVTVATPLEGKATALCFAFHMAAYRFTPSAPLPQALACPKCKSNNGTLYGRHFTDPAKVFVDFRCWDCELWMHLTGRDACMVFAGIVGRAARADEIVKAYAIIEAYEGPKTVCWN